MAKLIKYDSNNYEGESRVNELIQSEEKLDDWTVIWGLQIAKHQTKQVTIGGFRFTETSRRERIQNDIECAKEEKTKGTVGTDATIGAGEVAKRKLQL